MKYSRIVLIAALALLSACSSSHRPTYSGHEESTEGVPGFVNGKKVSPHVKLGQSYTVDGETYVPRMQADYVEEGLASWYGPGFHGGKTANGERFDSSELTAAHRTLPLPSIVRVTMVSTGKQVIVRVNDRGPFAHSRILDMSRGAAEKIGLLRAGVAKVRVEYMKNESAKFADLLAQGRDPKSIDLESEILNGSSPGATAYARNDAVAPASALAVEPAHSKSFWDSVGVSSANAAEPDATVVPEQDLSARDASEAAPVADVTARDLAAPAGAAPPPAVRKDEASPSPFAALEPAPAAAEEVATLAPANRPSPAIPPAGPPVYVQIGAFQNEANAERLREKFAGVDGLRVDKKTGSNGQVLYHVRMGPYARSADSNAAFEQLQTAGAEVKIIKE